MANENVEKEIHNHTEKLLDSIIESDIGMAQTQLSHLQKYVQLGHNVYQIINTACRKRYGRDKTIVHRVAFHEPRGRGQIKSIRISASKNGENRTFEYKSRWDIESDTVEHVYTLVESETVYTPIPF